jgi:hypothetical protein
MITIRLITKGNHEHSLDEAYHGKLKRIDNREIANNKWDAGV